MVLSSQLKNSLISATIRKTQGAVGTDTRGTSLSLGVGEVSERFLRRND